MADHAKVTTKIPAAILAGGPADTEMQARFSIQYRAELPVCGKMMLQRVVDALRDSSYVENICVVGNILCDGVTKNIPSADTMLENLIAGVNACADGSGDDRVLIVTSDIPLLFPGAVDDFIERCQGDADLYYPVVSKEDNDKRFPGVKRTYVKLAEGTFTGGNIMIMSTRFISENADLLREVMAARKSVAKLAGLVGFGTLLRVIIAQTVWKGAISLSTLERTVGRIMNAKVKAVQCPHPEIGADIDKIDQLDAMESLLISEGEPK
ncbi:MAG: NTP transferase domain-containing protein [Armatimonadota bacterium]